MIFNTLCVRWTIIQVIKNIIQSFGKLDMSLHPCLEHWQHPLHTVESTNVTNNYTVLYIGMQQFKYVYNVFTYHALQRNRTITLGPFGIQRINCSYFWTIIHRTNICNIVLQENQNIGILDSGCTNNSRSNNALVFAIPNISKDFALYFVPIMVTYEMIDQPIHATANKPFLG